MDEGKGGNEAGPGKLVKLEGRTRRRARTAGGAPTTESKTLPAPTAGDLRCLSEVERASLFPAEGDVTPANLTAAATGLAMLAARHLAHRLAAPGGDEELSGKDRIAMAIAPKLVAESRRSVRTTPSADARAGGDPIMELLTGPRDGDGTELVTDEQGATLKT